MIRLFTFKALLTRENRTSTHPLIFDLFYFENADVSIKQHYQLVDSQNEADAYIFPVDYLIIKEKGLEKHFKKMYQLAVNHQKKILIYTGGDYGKTFNDPYIITFRNSGFKSKMCDQTFVMPAFFDDPIKKYRLDLKSIPYQEKPQISFTGFATDSWRMHLFIYIANSRNNIRRLLGKEESDSQKFYNLALQRFKMLKKIETSNRIEADFIFRQKYRAGSVTEEQRKTSTEEFFENLNNSPYTFCLRGAGNFSVRFYESLACGRIPVLLDTDVQLPLEKQIDWDKHICRVMPQDTIIDRLVEFHKSHDEDTFKLIQESNREIYDNFLIRHTYFCKLHECLKPIL